MLDFVLPGQKKLIYYVRLEHWGQMYEKDDSSCFFSHFFSGVVGKKLWSIYGKKNSDLRWYNMRRG